MPIEQRSNTLGNKIYEKAMLIFILSVCQSSLLATATETYLLNDDC